MLINGWCFQDYVDCRCRACSFSCTSVEDLPVKMVSIGMNAQGMNVAQ